MYKHEIVITIEDSIVHHHSILEWETIFQDAGVIQRDELPLSYGRIAEILAAEYHKYGQPYFDRSYNSSASSTDIRETNNTTYTNANSATVNTRIPPAPEEPSTLQIGIMQY